MAIDEALRGVSEEEYGASYPTDLLKIYTLYVDLTDRVSVRRQTANSFFLTINTGIVALVGYVQLGSPFTDPAGVPQSDLFLIPIALAGIVLCFVWFQLIRAYRALNRARFKVIHEIERYLPIRPYDAEWQAFQLQEASGLRGSRYRPLTHIEVIVPWVFLAMHLVVLVGGTLL